jgi:hypothetical protein
MTKLPPNLDHALRAIHSKSDEALPGADIQKLLDENFITYDVVRGGWRTNSKGREYIKRFRTAEDHR